MSHSRSRIWLAVSIAVIGLGSCVLNPQPPVPGEANSPDPAGMGAAAGTLPMGPSEPGVSVGGGAGFTNGGALASAGSGGTASAAGGESAEPAGGAPASGGEGAGGEPAQGGASAGGEGGAS